MPTVTASASSMANGAPIDTSPHRAELATVSSHPSTFGIIAAVSFHNRCATALNLKRALHLLLSPSISLSDQKQHQPHERQYRNATSNGRSSTLSIVVIPFQFAVFCCRSRLLSENPSTSSRTIFFRASGDRVLRTTFLNSTLRAWRIWAPHAGSTPKKNCSG